MNLQERIAMVKNDPDNAAKLIYMWLKQGVINYKEFKTMVEAFYEH